MPLQIPRRRRKPVSIDMSPLIDCIFQLLIFFMLSSTFLTPAIKLTLPTAAAVDNAPDQFLMVTLGADDETYVNKDRVDPAQLRQRLSERLATHKDKVVTIRGHESVPLGRFVHALESAKQAGASNVNVAHSLPK